MNSSTLDISSLSDIKIGDKVTLIGNNGSIQLDINGAAHSSGTIAGELLTRIGKSIPRTYKSNAVESQKLDDYNKPDGQHVKIRLVKTEKNLPPEITSYMLATFIYNNTAGSKLDQDVLVNQIDYALSSDKRGGGFIILAYNKGVIHGVNVILYSEKIGMFPEYSIAYICSDEAAGESSIFKLLVSSALKYTDGKTSTYIKSDDPAVPALKDLGFSISNIEMSIEKEK